MKRIAFVLFFYFSLFSLFAQNAKYEFRGVWVATLANIDWPSSGKAGTEMQKYELIELFDKFKQAGLNAVVLQVRPSAEVIYPSEFEPWSRYITGKQGVAPEPFYDPLQFAIEEAHKRGMELHAWFNPYRALTNSANNPNPSNHVTYTHPEWFLNYGDKKYFDPGLPEVREYVTKVVMEAVMKYDIDAVHFDDYFYPYRIAGKEFPDYKSYALYGSDYSDKGDWRRHNVDLFVENINKEIKKIKPNVKLGISPFGVWRNASKDPLGSNTNGGQTNYDDLYADVRLWLQKGWIDYVLPQLYWEQGHKSADYNTLLDWWSKNSFGKHLYIGHGLYQMGTNKKPCWQSTNEIVQQVEALRNTPNVHGSCYYSANSFKKNTFGIVETLQFNINKQKAKMPPMPWLIKNVAEEIVVKENKPKQDNIQAEKQNAPVRSGFQKPLVTVQNNNGNKIYILEQSELATQTIIYKFDKQMNINEYNIAPKLKWSNNNKEVLYTKNKSQLQNINESEYIYVITSMDAKGNESEPFIINPTTAPVWKN